MPWKDAVIFAAQQRGLTLVAGIGSMPGSWRVGAELHMRKINEIGV